MIFYRLLLFSFLTQILAIDDPDETRRLIHKAEHQSYGDIILELTKDRRPQALVEFTNIMNNGDLSRKTRNEKLDEWGTNNNCKEAVDIFKIKEKLLEDEEIKERTKIIDMFQSAAFQIKDIMQDEEMAPNEKREFIDTLVETTSESIKPLLYSIFPSLLKERLSSDEIIGIPGQNYVDKVVDTNEILSDVNSRDELTAAKKREEIIGFINGSGPRVRDVLRLLWPKFSRKRRHLLKHPRRRHIKEELGQLNSHKHLGKIGRRPPKIPPYFSKDNY